MKRSRSPLLLMTWMTGIAILAVLFVPPLTKHYQILRWLVPITAMLGFRRSLEIRDVGAAFTYGILLTLFNPLVPLHTTKDLWQVIDFGTGLVLWFLAVFTSEAGIEKATRNKQLADQSSNPPFQPPLDFYETGVFDEIDKMSEVAK